MLPRLLALAALLALLPAAAQSQEFRPIADVLNDGGEDVAVIAYAFRRCAALYLNFQQLMADDNPELSAQFAELSGMAAVRAHMLAQEKQEREIDVETTFNEVMDIAVVYRDRATRNRALTGDYFAQDPLVTSDGETCQAMREALR